MCHLLSDGAEDGLYVCIHAIFMRALFQLFARVFFAIFKLFLFVCLGVVHIADPWSSVQKSYLVYQLCALVAGVWLVMRHWTRGPEYDPSPGRFGSLNLDSLWAAISFRGHTMRVVYANVFKAVCASSAFCLAKNIVHFTSTSAVTVVGVLADCVVPMHATDGSVLTATGRRRELLLRGGCVCVLGTVLFLISSLTKVRVVAMLLDSVGL